MNQYLFGLKLRHDEPMPLPDLLMANISTWNLNEAQVGFLITWIELAGADLKRTVDAETFQREFFDTMKQSPTSTYIGTFHVPNQPPRG